MDYQEIIVSLKAVIAPFVEQEGFELVDLTVRREGRDLFLRIFADRPDDGITIGECARLNREISLILDEKDMIAERYILEVSSPGLDRPLTTQRDFARCLNKEVKIFLKEMVAGKLEWDGVINKVQPDSVFVDVKGNILKMPIVKINKAKRIIYD